MARILIVEDEISIQKLLTYDLKQAGFEVQVATDGLEAYRLIKEQSFDLVLLDVMLPKLDGIELCKRLRAENNEIYIIMLTALDEEIDKITGLDAGADDYMTKPFSPREVIARIKAGLRRNTRSTKEVQDLLVIGDLTINTRKHEVYINETILPLTFKEYQLLHFLVENKDVALSRDVLLETLWGFEYDGDTRIVDVHIFKLREKLANSRIRIVTIRGLGYRLEEEQYEA